jgi:hypothetical protein
MMPIHMSLVISQNSISALLTHCANSKMPIEVKRLRVNAESSNVVDLSLTGAGEGGGAPGGRSGSGRRPGGYLGEGGFGGELPRNLRGPEAEAAAMAASGYVNLELQGIIYIYNPPDRQRLGTGAASEPVAETPTPETTETPAPETTVTPAPETTETPEPPAAEPVEPPAAGPAEPPAGAPGGMPAGAPAAAPGAPPAGAGPGPVPGPG